MKMLARSVVAGTFLAVMPVAGTTQTPEAVRVYAGAHPYVYEDISSIKMVVKGLSGVKPNADQTMLPEILDKAGQVLVQQVPRMPNLIAQEDVGVERLTSVMTSVQTGRRGGTIMMPSESTLTPGDWKRYEYIILVKQHEGEEGVAFEESRQEAGKKNEGSARGVGFASLWLMFIPHHRPESHFRLLGTQKMNHRETYVVAFAQDPELVKIPGEVVVEKGIVPLLLQGVAWIDQENYRILRLRTDLLAPLPSANLQQVSSTIEFSEVKIPKFETPLWLAKRVEILWNLNSTQMGEIHLYTNYHLFHATVRIVP